MHKIKRFGVLALLMFVAAIVIIFTLENSQPVTLVFLAWPTPQASVAVYMVLALLLGCCLGPVIGWLAGLRVKCIASKDSKV